LRCGELVTYVKHGAVDEELDCCATLKDLTTQVTRDGLYTCRLAKDAFLFETQ
jgi:hypothetical protein